jgi:Opioid growth factor receptor (OGFr) conserved region
MGMNFVAFYRGEAPDHLGRMLEDILRWNDNKLEAGHDYIHVLFPLLEPSAHIPTAPVLDAATLAEFHKDPAIQKNLVRAFQVMLRFYGFELDTGNRAISPAVDFRAKAADWLFVGDHNHLRITRILKCLHACGLHDHAAAFLEALLAVAEPGRVSDETLGYWKRAVAGA